MNGTSDDTDGTSSRPAETQAAAAAAAAKAVAAQPDTAVISADNATYNVTVCYDSTELVYFGVQKASHTVHNVTEATADAATVSSTNSPSGSAAAAAAASVDKKTHEIKGMAALRDFICSQFQISVAPAVASTPAAMGGRRSKAVVGQQATPASTPSSGSRRKRGAAQLDAEAEAEEQPKSSKKAKVAATAPATPVTPTVTSSEVPEKAVLARWVDKKFYAGHVLEKKANNKFVVLFEDGARKTLPEEHIVFGQENVLPLLHEAVHALVTEDTYEPGLVQAVDAKPDGTYYTVLCETTTVTVTASNIYLEEDQAKVILSKYASNAATNPEPGFSGAGSTRKDRRQKRYS